MSSVSKALERFLRYVQVSTPSDGESTATPSSACQWDLARLLEKEMREMGLADVKIEDGCIVTGTLPAREAPQGTPRIGFIAHMDTVTPGMNVHPRVVDAYDGGDIPLDEAGKIVLSPKMFPGLADFAGQRLVVTDGTTVLGADDKAGVAAILTAADELLHSDVPHAQMRIAFTPDEEVGRGVESFKAGAFGVDFGYTMDGGGVGGFQLENFNAASARIIIHGNSVHPGGAKAAMVHAAEIAGEFITMVPQNQRAQTTEGYEGFFHLTGMSGEVERAQLDYILRDFDSDKLEWRKAMMQTIGNTLNLRYGAGTVEVIIRNQYRNMLERVKDFPEVVTLAREAMAVQGIDMAIGNIRGGTDGASISNMADGFPCPNMSAGGCNGHGKFEYLVEGHLLTAVEVIKGILTLAAKGK